MVLYHDNTPWIRRPAFKEGGLYKLPINTGNQIQITISATSATSGSTTLENISAAESFSHTWSNMSPDLCFDTAEWIVEYYYLNWPVPFAAFGTIRITDANVIANGATVGAASGFEVGILPSGTRSVEVTGSIDDNTVIAIVSLTDENGCTRTSHTIEFLLRYYQTAPTQPTNKW